jgi:hypothetical protein
MKMKMKDRVKKMRITDEDKWRLELVVWILIILLRYTQLIDTILTLEIDSNFRRLIYPQLLWSANLVVRAIDQSLTVI